MCEENVKSTNFIDKIVMVVHSRADSERRISRMTKHQKKSPNHVLPTFFAFAKHTTDNKNRTFGLYVLFPQVSPSWQMKTFDESPYDLPFIHALHESTDSSEKLRKECTLMGMFGLESAEYAHVTNDNNRGSGSLCPWRFFHPSVCKTCH